MSSVGNIYFLIGPPVTISGETREASVSPCANKLIQKILFQQAFNEFSKFIGELKELHFRDWVILCPTQPVSKPPAHVLPLCLFFLSDEATIPSPPILHSFPLAPQLLPPTEPKCPVIKAFPTKIVLSPGEILLPAAERINILCPLNKQNRNNDAYLIRCLWEFNEVMCLPAPGL